MDRQERHDKHANCQEWMAPPRNEVVSRPGHDLSHAARRIEWRGCFKHDTEALPIRIERLNAIGKLLVLTPMPLVLGAVFEQHLVELLDVIFGEGDRLPA